MTEKKFEIVADNDDFGNVKCIACGCQFDYDVHDEENLIMDTDKKYLVLVCPACNSGLPEYPERNEI
jgi:DNA-directed RNA polymerase subunit RPC12/RpoP